MIFPQTGQAHLESLVMGFALCPQMGHGPIKTVPFSVKVKIGMLTIAAQWLQRAGRKANVKRESGVCSAASRISGCCPAGNASAAA